MTWFTERRFAGRKLNNPMNSTNRSFQFHTSKCMCVFCPKTNKKNALKIVFNFVTILLNVVVLPVNILPMISIRAVGEFILFNANKAMHYDEYANLVEYKDKIKISVSMIKIKQFHFKQKSQSASLKFALHLFYFILK